MSEVITDKTNRKGLRWLLTLAIIFFILLALDLAGSMVLNEKFKNRIYPNVYVGNLNLGGTTAEQARRLINAELDKINQRGIIFSYKNYQTNIKPVVASADGDLAYQIINFDVDQTVSRALSASKNIYPLISLPEILYRYAVKQSLPLAVSVNQAAVEKILKDNFSPAYEPARDAELIIKKSSYDNYEFAVTEEKLGKTIDYEDIIATMLNNLAKLDTAEIKLSTITEYPKILARDCLNINSKAEAILNAAPITLKYKENKWIINQGRLSQLLALKPNNSANDKVRVGLADEPFKAYLAEQIAPQINQAPQEAKFQIQNGKVSEFQNGQDGLELDLAATLAKIENEIYHGGLPAQAGEIDLVIKTQPVLVKAGNINDFGVKEIIGVGTSNFKGSPVNRRHNIKVGAASVNGTLIKPGEEFSLLKTLGQVASSTGYLPELVIKEGKTLPEFGGGLCQIGTTVFRAVIDSGLPVTMRRNHSYRVQYYEPAGTDATIYDPWPDFRFINDTANYILIQSKLSGDNLSFEFWGARDGRIMEKTQSVIYNIVKPEPTKLIETLSLKPGEKKCTEHAHNGADAYFDYKVTYADGKVEQKRFSSHYVPWQEVCLIGVEKLSAPPDTATSTPAAN